MKKKFNAPDIDINRNAFNQKNNTGYYYQALDIRLIQNEIMAPYLTDFIVHDPIGDATTVDQFLLELIDSLNENKPTLCVYNLSNNHWVTFAALKINDEPVILYKDSLGATNVALRDQIKSIKPNAQFIHNTGHEQTAGVDCGIFSIKNMAIMAEHLKNNKDAFIQGFNTFNGFCNLQLAKDLRQGEFADKYVVGKYQEMVKDAIKSNKLATLRDQHYEEVEAIKAKLEKDDSFEGFDIIALESSKSEDKTLENSIFIEIGIIPGNDLESNGYQYTYRIHLSNNLSARSQELSLNIIRALEAYPTERGEGLITFAENVVNSIRKVPKKVAIDHVPNIKIKDLLGNLSVQSDIPADEPLPKTPQEIINTVNQHCTLTPPPTMPTPSKSSAGKPKVNDKVKTSHQKNNILKMFELIEEGKEEIQGKVEQGDNIVMLVGSTGSGKSTLLNYINEVKLEAFSTDNGATHKLKAKTAELPSIKIGHSATTSCTRHPGIFAPENGKYKYADFPGFGDTGDKETHKVVQDVANAYFRKGVTDLASKLKTVLVVTYDDLVKRGGSLANTMQDLCSFISGIENTQLIDQITKSMSIVVTKFPGNGQEERAKKLKDIKKWEAKIEETKAENKKIESDTNSTINGINSAISTLQNLVSSGVGDQALIGLIEAQKARIEEVTKQKSERIESLSKGSKKYEKKIQAAKKFLSSSISPEEIASKAVVDYLNDLNQTNISQNAKDILSSVVKQGRLAVFSTIKEGDKSFEEADRIKKVISSSSYIKKADAGIEIQISDNNAAQIFRELDQLEQATKIIANKINQDLTKQLSEAFDRGELKVIQAKKCLETIKTFTNECSLESFGKALRSPIKLPDGKKINMLKLSDTTITMIEDFNKTLEFLVDLLKPEDLVKYNKNKNWLEVLKLSTKIDQYIKDEAEILAAPKAPDELDNGTLTIKGYFIKTSQVDSIINKYTGIKNIEINALHTIEIDNDLASHNPKCAGKLHGVNLTMISPCINVIGNRTIDLSGKDGAAHQSAAANGNGHDSTGNGTRGADGLPGLPGQSAGNLLVISDKIIGLDNLEAKLNGGNGGAGQTGGNGVNGHEGRDAEYIQIPNPAPHLFPGENLIIRDSGWISTGQVSDWRNGKRDEHFIKRGEDGGRGGDGGKGGKGGDNGKGGEYKIISGGLIDISSGKNGNAQNHDGAQGVPGTGGKNGKNAEAVWHDDPGVFNSYHYWNGHHLPRLVERGNAPGGNMTGINVDRWEPSPFISKIEANLVLNDYKLFLAQEQSNNNEIVGNFTEKFSVSCNKIPLDGLSVSVESLIDEAKALENYLKKYYAKIDFLPFYKSLLSKIKEYTLQPGSAHSPEELKALEYLYARVLGGINHLKATDDTLLVIDIPGYLKNATGNVKTLKTLTGDKLRDHYRNEYEEKINDKIAEANNFIRLLKGDINDKQQAIEPQVHKLKREVEQALMNASQDKLALETKKQELESALSKNAIFGALQIVAQGIGMIFPPAGPIVAGVVNAGLDMAKEPTFNSVTNFAAKTIEMYDKLAHLPSSPASATKQEKDLFNKVKDIAGTVKPLVTDALALLKAHGEGQAQLAQLQQQIDTINNNIQTLHVYNQTVPNAFGLYMEGVVSQVDDFQGALQDKSLAGLDFSRPEARRMFEAVKGNIKALTGKFAASEGFEAIVTALEEAIDISANICCRVQDYQEQILFANYIAHLHSPGVHNVNAGKYTTAIQELDLAIQHNIVQEQYCRAISTVAQWAFPFAEKYLGGIADLYNLDDANMSNNLTALYQKVDQDRKTLQNIDQTIMISSFKDSLPSSPFFVWDYKDHPQEIDDLLACKPVMLKADISNTQKYAVKFNKIGIEINSSDGTDNAALHNLLEAHFSVSLTHGGNSYYKYGEKTYEMSNDQPFTLTYFFNTHRGCPVAASQSYYKMLNGDLLASPYAYWIIKLNPETAEAKRIDFSKIDKSHLKISLEGEGSYVDVTKSPASLDIESLSTYYHEVPEDIMLIGDYDFTV